MRAGKLVTLLLGATSLLLIALLVGGVLSEPSPDARGGAEIKLPALPVPDDSQFEMRGEEEFVAINERPLFNDDRRPREPSEVQEDGGEEAVEVAANKQELDVALQGVIISPQYRIAMITDNVAKKNLSLRVGENLEGELAAWSLTMVEARKVTFENSQRGKSTDLELAVFKSALPSKVGAKKPAAKKGAKKRTNKGARKRDDADKQRQEKEGGKPDDAADEVRRKVAARRAKMRAEAAKRRAKKDDEQQ